jgi:hypothetical protein
MLIDDIRNHLAVMNEDQRKRRTAVLLRDAAAEIERPRLTDAEREAIKWFATYGYSSDGAPGRNAATLRGLLERANCQAIADSSGDLSP